MSEDEELYHNEEIVIDVLENVFIFKNTHDNFTKLDLECIHDLVHLYKQKKEENRKLRNCHLRYEEMTGIDLLLED